MSAAEGHRISIMGGIVQESETAAVVLSCSVCGVVKWWENGVLLDMAATIAAAHGAEAELGGGKLIIPDTIEGLDETDG